MNSKIIIIGAGGHAESVFNVAISAGYEVLAFIDDKKAGKALFDKRVIQESQNFSLDQDTFLAIGVGDNFSREQIVAKYIQKFSLEKFPYLIHSSSNIGAEARIGYGTVIMPNVSVGPKSNVETFCILNTHSSIDHECKISDYASIAPGVHTGGNVSVGVRSAISIGASVKQGVSIGNDSVVGASSLVLHDVPERVVSFGIPSTTIRSRNQDDPYLS
jgi:sugar O-acyltransferase (sialic acid O-acetyltransferase NeuD family)